MPASDNLVTSLDITAPDMVEVTLHNSALWVNVDGICRLRVCKIQPTLYSLSDNRTPPYAAPETQDVGVTALQDDIISRLRGAGIEESVIGCVCEWIAVGEQRRLADDLEDARAVDEAAEAQQRYEYDHRNSAPETPQ